MTENALVFAADEVGAATLEYLLASGEQIDLVVLTKDTPEIRTLVKEAGAPFLDNPSAEQVKAKVSGRKFKWLLNLWSSMILRQDILDCAEQRLNIHPGLLPGARGSHGATWSIRDNLPSGVSLLEMTDELDAGAVFAEMEVDTTLPVKGAALQRRLKDACTQIFKANWPGVRDGVLIAKPQSGEARTYTVAQTTKDRTRQLEEGSAEMRFLRWLLAHDFAPGTTAEIEVDGRRFKLRAELEEID